MLYYESEHGLVTWDETLRSVLIEWKGFAYGKEFQSILLQGANLLKQMGGSKVLMDTRQGSAIKAEDKAWIGEYFVRRVYDNGLRRLAMLEPNSVVAKLSINRTVNGLGTLPYLQESFTDWDAAVEWLSHSESPALAIS